MKIAGYDKAIVYQMGGMFDAVIQEKGTMTDLHHLLMQLPVLSEEAVTELAIGPISEKLSELAIEDPHESQYKCMGFAPYGEEVNGVFALAIPGTKAIVLRIEKRERVLPGVSVRNETSKRMSEIQAKEMDGWTPTRKDWAEVREDVEARMLKTAPIRPSFINVIIDTPYIYTFSSSAKVVEDCSALLRTAFGSWPVGHALVDEYSLRSFMRNVALDRIKEASAETFIHLKHDDGDDIKLKDTDIENNAVVMDSLESHYTVRAIDMSIDTGLTASLGDIWFRLADKAIISGIQVGDADYDALHEATLDRYGTDGSAFLSMMANLFQLVHSLRAMMEFFELQGCVNEFTRSTHSSLLAGAIFDFKQSLTEKGITFSVVDTGDDEDDDDVVGEIDEDEEV